jgi:sugar-specific transcriptional regulator TrmB
MQIKNPSLLTKLEKSGFTDKEALVYVSVLELGGAKQGG